MQSDYLKGAIAALKRLVKDAEAYPNLSAEWFSKMALLYIAMYESLLNDEKLDVDKTWELISDKNTAKINEEIEKILLNSDIKNKA